jgi:hypothetical protein
MLTAGKNDADAAAAAFVNCDADDGYDDDSVQYCLERRIEAEGIVKMARMTRESSVYTANIS